MFVVLLRQWLKLLSLLLPLRSPFFAYPFLVIFAAVIFSVCSFWFLSKPLDWRVLAWSQGIASSLPAVPCQVQHSSAGLGAAFLVVIIQSMAFGKLMGKSSCVKFVVPNSTIAKAAQAAQDLLQEPSNLVLKILNLPNPFLRLRGKAYTFPRACEGCFLHPVSTARGCLTNAWSGDAITRAWLVIVSF